MKGDIDLLSTFLKIELQPVKKCNIIVNYSVCRRSRNMNEVMSLGDSINHVYTPSLTD